MASEAGLPQIFCDKPSVNAKDALLLDPELELTSFEGKANLIWRRRNYRQVYDKLTEHQCLNHIPNEPCMTDKGKLLLYLQRHEQSAAKKELSLNSFYKESYRLYVKEERDAFFKQLPEKDNEENLWIMKPTKLSQGSGIRILWQFDELREKFRLESANPKFLVEGHGEQNYIIQRYIKDVLLLNKRKSEIRIYWLIASLDPLLILFYPEGTARFTLSEFKLGDYDNPSIHITNIHQQKKQGGFDKDTVLKWNFSVLQNYLLKEKLTANTQFIDEQLIPEMKQSLKYVIAATIDALKKTPPKGQFFGLYGADFILDNTLHPWLTEIQKGPGLSHDDPIKQKIIVNMLQETVHIMLEVQERKRKKQNLANLKSIKRFEQIINKD